MKGTLDREKFIQLTEFIKQEIEDKKQSLENLKKCKTGSIDRQIIGYISGQIQGYTTSYYILESFFNMQDKEEQGGSNASVV